MTYEPQPPQYPPTQPYVSGAPQHQGPPKKPKNPWIIGGVVVLVLSVLCCVGILASVFATDSGKQGFNDGKKGATSASPSKTPWAVQNTSAPQRQKHTPIAAEIKLTIKVTKKQCFGSAGCLVDFRIDKLSYIGEPMDESKSYEVIYEVTGLKDPYTNTLTLNGNGEFEYQQSEDGQTKTTSVKLAAKVTSVEAL